MAISMSFIMHHLLIAVIGLWTGVLADAERLVLNNTNDNNGEEGDILWGWQMGSKMEDQVAQVAVDSAGDIFMAGYTLGSFLKKYQPDWYWMFDTEVREEAWCAKLNGSTGEFLWGWQRGAARRGDTAYATALVVTAEGDALVAGGTNGAMFRANAAAGDDEEVLTFGTGDIWAVRLDGQRGAIVWSWQDGSTQDDEVLGAALDPLTGDLLLAGYTRGDLFARGVSPAAVFGRGGGGPGLQGPAAPFACRLAAASGAPLWGWRRDASDFARVLLGGGGGGGGGGGAGGRGEDAFATSATFDARGHVYLAGYGRGTPLDEVGTLDKTWVVKILERSGAVVWATQFGKPGSYSFSASITIDAQQNVVVTGGTAPVSVEDPTWGYTTKLAGSDGSIMWQWNHNSSSSEIQEFAAEPLFWDYVADAHADLKDTVWVVGNSERPHTPPKQPIDELDSFDDDAGSSGSSLAVNATGNASLAVEGGNSTSLAPSNTTAPNTGADSTEGLDIAGPTGEEEEGGAAAAWPWGTGWFWLAALGGGGGPGGPGGPPAPAAAAGGPPRRRAYHRGGTSASRERAVGLFRTEYKPDPQFDAIVIVGNTWGDFFTLNSGASDCWCMKILVPAYERFVVLETSVEYSRLLDPFGLGLLLNAAVILCLVLIVIAFITLYETLKDEFALPPKPKKKPRAQQAWFWAGNKKQKVNLNGKGSKEPKAKQKNKVIFKTQSFYGDKGFFSPIGSLFKSSRKKKKGAEGNKGAVEMKKEDFFPSSIARRCSKGGHKNGDTLHGSTQGGKKEMVSAQQQQTTKNNLFKK